MSNSFRKTPIIGRTKAVSEKIFKRIWHKRLRANQRDAMAAIDENWEGDDPNIHPKEVSSPFLLGKGGMQYISEKVMSNIAKRHASKAKSAEERDALKARARAKVLAK